MYRTDHPPVTKRKTTMWPVQTLTLLLCLTEEEQLFAQRVQPEPVLPVIEAPAPEAEEDDERTCQYPSC
jgi:hypothetical protein